MKLVIDSFINDYDWFRTYCDTLTYGDIENPVDKVIYPGISLQIPSSIREGIISRMESEMKMRISDVTMFLRLTVGGAQVPHQAHTDSSMGDYGAVVYLSRPEHCKGGTSFVKHIATGMDANPTNEAEEKLWVEDTNNYDQWEITEMVEMAPNRGLIFETKYMHRPEPPTGFGESSSDGRLVLVCFVRVF